MSGCLTVVLMSLRAVLTHVEVGHAAVSQDHDEFGLVGPKLLFSSCIQLLCIGKTAPVEIMEKIPQMFYMYLSLYAGLIYLIGHCKLISYVGFFC